MTKTELLNRLAEADPNAEITVFVDDIEDPTLQFGFAIREVNIGWTTEAHYANTPRGNLVGIVLEGAINGNAAQRHNNG